jgi:hypothetical protein
MTTTSPDWMFGLLLASGGVAMCSGIIFVAAVGCGVWALLTMTTSMVPTAGPC